MVHVCLKAGTKAHSQPLSGAPGANNIKGTWSQQQSLDINIYIQKCSVMMWFGIWFNYSFSYVCFYLRRANCIQFNHQINDPLYIECVWF